MDWTPAHAAALATTLLSSMGDRWAHVRAVGGAADALATATSCVPTQVIVAAWLHDVGYARRVRSTGFHPVDGARFLSRQSAPVEVVSLVAYHTGATFEAEERGLVDELAVFELPDESALDLLTFVDLTTGATGGRLRVRERLDEIMTRYAEDDPVYRAVSRSRPALIAACERAVSALGLSDEWLLSPV